MSERRHPVRGRGRAPGRVVRRWTGPRGGAGAGLLAVASSVGALAVGPLQVTSLLDPHGAAMTTALGSDGAGAACRTAVGSTAGAEVAHLAAGDVRTTAPPYGANEFRIPVRAAGRYVATFTFPTDVTAGPGVDVAARVEGAATTMPLSPAPVDSAGTMRTGSVSAVVTDGTFSVALGPAVVAAEAISVEVRRLPAETCRAAPGEQVRASAAPDRSPAAAMPPAPASAPAVAASGGEQTRAGAAVTTPAAPSSTVLAAAPHETAVTTPPAAASASRPFAPDSVWNTPIGAAPAIDGASAAMVASITPGNRAYANLYAFGTPIYTVDDSDPLATVHCTMPWGTCDLEGRQIRVPADARPASGSDGQMVLIDVSARTVCDFWQARKEGTGRWTASWATCASLDGDGSGPSGGSTGAGVNTLAGVIRTSEIQRGVIPHAVSVATANSCADVFRSPATKTDGVSRRADCIPEGARLQLDPSIDVARLPGITPGEVAVARALQVYGAINRDNSAAPLAVCFENPAGGPDPYAEAGLPWDYFDMPHIPWNRLRVLR